MDRPGPLTTTRSKLHPLLDAVVVDLAAWRSEVAPPTGGVAVE
jgi:hypothetical protein